MSTGILPAPLTGKNGRHPLPDPDVFVDWLGRMGVSNAKQVVGYDHAGGTYAARLWWMLRWVGHPKRGRARRRLAGMDCRRPAGCTKDVPAPKPAKFSGRPENP